MKFITIIVWMLLSMWGVCADSAEFDKELRKSNEMAVQHYPDAAKIGSPLYNAIAARVAELKANDPNYFTHSNWPVMVAIEQARKLGIEPIIPESSEQKEHEIKLKQYAERYNALKKELEELNKQPESQTTDSKSQRDVVIEWISHQRGGAFLLNWLKQQSIEEQEQTLDFIGTQPKGRFKAFLNAMEDRRERDSARLSLPLDEPQTAQQIPEVDSRKMAQEHLQQQQLNEMKERLDNLEAQGHR